MSKNHLDELPHSWFWTTLGEIADINMGQSPPSSTYNKEKIGLPFYQGKSDFGSLFPTPKVWCSSPSKVADAGDVLISVRAPVGPTNLCVERSCIGRGLAALKPRLGMPSKYTLFYLKSIEERLSQMGTGTTFRAIKRSNLESLPFPLAPLAEQKRIVTKVDTLFAESKTVRESLEIVLALLQKLRQSILTKAFRGDLIEHDPSDEPAENLHERIRKERRGGQIRLVESKGKNSGELPELPEQWTHTRLGEVIDIKYGRGLPGRSRISTGHVEVYGSNGVIGHHNEAITDGPTIVIGRKGSVGAINKSKDPCWPIDTTYYVDKVPRGLELDFLFHFLESQPLANLDKSTTIPGINRNDLYRVIMPLPPTGEQKRIVSEIEELFSLIDSTESAVIIAKNRAEKIDHAILAKAFSGRLVSQDPKDEPASILLQRIKVHTSKKQKVVKKKRRR